MLLTTPKAVSVFDHDEPVLYLRDVLAEKKRRSRGFSLRAWSRQLGFRTPSYLSAVLSGDRRLKPELATRIAGNLRLEGGDAERFELLVLRSNAKSDAERARFDRLLRNVGPRRGRHRLALDRFALVSEWYHWVVLEMLALPNFRPDSTWIGQRLAGRIRPDLVDAALRRLLRLKLVRREKDGSLIRMEGETFVGDDIPNAHIRAHHRQFLDKAKTALEDQSAEERDFRGSTFLFRRERLGEARELIREFHHQLRALADDGTGNVVYRFSSQLFRMTETETEA